MKSEWRKICSKFLLQAFCFGRQQKVLSFAAQELNHTQMASTGSIYVQCNEKRLVLTEGTVKISHRILVVIMHNFTDHIGSETLERLISILLLVLVVEASSIFDISRL